MPGKRARDWSGSASISISDFRTSSHCGKNFSQVDAVVSYIDADSGAIGYLTGVPMLARYFYELARLVSTEEKGLFKHCVFTLDRNGRYDTNFVYE